VESNSPLEKSTLQVAYNKIRKVQTVPRGLGFWGDMVVTFTNGEKIELRSLERHKEFEAYIKERMPKEEVVSF